MTYYHEVKKRKNSRKYTPIKSFETEEEVLNYLKENNLTFKGSPFIFTYIILSDDSRITQKIRGLVCSPETLKKCDTRRHELGRF